jgi:hypothetical protein
MSKVKVLIFFLAVLILSASPAAAYETSSQRQRIESEVEVKSDVNSQTTIKQEGEQKQIQHIQVEKRIETAKRPAMIRDSSMNEENGEDKKVRTSPTPESKSEKRLENCEQVTERLNKHSAAIKANYEKREANFKRAYDTLTELITRLSTSNVDVSKLQAAADALQAERMQLLVTLDSYLASIDQFKAVACTASSEERRTKFSAVQKARTAYEQQLKKVVEVINSKVKPALVEVKQLFNN